MQENPQLFSKKPPSQPSVSPKAPLVGAEVWRERSAAYLRRAAGNHHDEVAHLRSTIDIALLYNPTRSMSRHALH